MPDKWVAEVTVYSGLNYTVYIQQDKQPSKKVSSMFFIKQGKIHTSGAKLKIQYRIREHNSIFSALFTVVRHLWMY